MSISVDSEFSDHAHHLTCIKYDTRPSPCVSDDDIYTDPVYSVSWVCEGNNKEYYRDFVENEESFSFNDGVNVKCGGCDSVISVSVKMEHVVVSDKVVT